MKKLLIIGSYYTELEIVRRAKELGYWTIVTDNHEESSQTPAKREADEALSISWQDIDLLTEYCSHNNVSGVIGGFSEFRVESMIRLCNNLHYPCSLSLDQLAVTRNKKLFKSLCDKYFVPCVREFQISDSDIVFPIIVKPVDLAGSAGISVVYDSVELQDAFNDARQLSGSGDVILEEYMGDGVKVDVYYYVKNGQPHFLGSSDTIMCQGQEGSKVLQSAWPFPSRHEDAYIREVDPAMREMIGGLGIDNCYLTISLFWRNDRFYCFEAGFRLSGEMSFNYYSAISGYDYLEDMIKYCVGDKTAPLPVENSRSLYALVLNFYALNGTISRIEGEIEVKALPEVYDFLIYCEPEETITNKSDVFKKIAMCTLVSPSREKIRMAVSYVNAAFSVKSRTGNEMIYEKLTLDQLDDYYLSS